MNDTATAAVILAAGRGSRMLGLTAERPKCLVELAGRPLLHWQLGALRAAGIGRILVVRGYAAQCLEGDFATVENPRWAETNMVSSLLCAGGFAHKFFASGGERLVVSYSDIVYHPEHVCRLLAASGDIAITYDTEWEALWLLRFEDVLSDAETFRQEDGLLREIGGRPTSLAQIHGQYMGLLCFSKAGWETLEAVCAGLGPQAVDKLDMTSLLRLLLAQGAEIEAVPVAGRWCEADSGTDLKNYEAALASGHWSHDWREDA
ncbi:MAG: phosphocholine cytidylyltransferase family protein [Desulfovibrio sp.]|nr:phosphocholine cytidylyltransferase family protein [Desulfovibrio sp.]